MHKIQIVIFLVALGSIFSGLEFLSDAYHEYKVHLITLTVVYFGYWLFSKKIVQRFGGEAQSHELILTKTLEHLRKIASFPFSIVAALYIVFFTVVFSLTLLFTDRSFSAILISGLGFG